MIGFPTQPASYNSYLYAQNNPLNLIDPSGQFPSIAQVGVTAGIIAVLASINFIAIALELHPFLLSNPFDEITKGDERFDSFSGSWWQMSSSVDLTFGGATGSVQKTVSMAVGDTPVATIHNEFVFTVPYGLLFKSRQNLGLATGFFAGLYVGGLFIDKMPSSVGMIIGNTFGTVGDLTVAIALVQRYIGHLAVPDLMGPQALSSLIASKGATVGLSFGLGYVHDARESSMLSGFAFGGNGGACGSAGAFGAGVVFGADFGFDKSGWTGLWTLPTMVLSGNVGAQTPGFSGCGGAVGFLGMQEHRRGP